MGRAWEAGSAAARCSADTPLGPAGRGGGREAVGMVEGRSGCQQQQQHTACVSSMCRERCMGAWCRLSRPSTRYCTRNSHPACALVCWRYAEENALRVCLRARARVPMRVPLCVGMGGMHPRGQAVLRHARRQKARCPPLSIQPRPQPHLARACQGAAALPPLCPSPPTPTPNPTWLGRVQAQQDLGIIWAPGPPLRTLGTP